MASATLQTGLLTDKCLVDTRLFHLLSQQGRHSGGVVNEAMRYSVLGPAQRIRPILALRVARVFQAPVELTLRAALALELLHCASLIVDDLPCMDDSPLRRGQPSVHVQFGEATAVLAAFGLVALAARTLVEAECPESRCERLIQFQISLLRSLDCAGLIAGQALDLNLASQSAAISQVCVSEMKTVPLFMLAISAGSLYADLDENEQALLNGFGREFGLAFQMTDDVLDGEPADRSALEDKFTTLRATIAPFGPSSRDLEELVDYLHARVAVSHPKQ